MITIKPLASSSRGNCYYVTDGVTPILLECGISFNEIRKQLDFHTSDIMGCLVTHEHNDHSKSVQDVMKAGIDCYMSNGTSEALKISGHRNIVVKALEQVQIGSWTILPFETQHDAAEPIGYLMANQAGDKLLYATDTYYIKYRFNGLTHVMVECNYARDILNKNVESGSVPEALKRRIIRSHFELSNVKEFLKANDLSRVNEIWLVHLSDNNADEARFKREIQALTGKMVKVAKA